MARPWTTVVTPFGLDWVRVASGAKTEAIVERSPLLMPALKSWRYFVTTVVACGSGDVVLCWALAGAPQAASTLMRSMTRKVSRANSFACRVYVFIRFLVLSAIAGRYVLQM